MGVLGLHHAEDDVHRSRHALLELGKRLGDDLAAGRIVAAVEPDFGAVGNIGMEAADGKPLEPRPPLGVGEALFERAGVERVAEQKLGGGDRGPGIVNLMGALQARQRQVQQSRRRAEDEPAVLLVHIEVAAGDMERRANLIGARLDHAKRFGLLPADHARDARLEDAGLFARDLRPACRRERRHGRSRPG